MGEKQLLTLAVIVGRTSAQAIVKATEAQAAWLRSHEMFLWRDYRGREGIMTPEGFVPGRIEFVSALGRWTP